MPAKLTIMDEVFIRQFKEHNKVTYYLLPLIMLNKFSFGEGNFIGSYVTCEGSMVCVDMLNSRLCPDALNHPTFHEGWVMQGEGFGGDPVGLFHRFWYKLDEGWELDFKLWKQGLYGRLTDSAKSMIRTYSGMQYRQPTDDGQSLFTDYRLLVLDRNPALRKKWECELDLEEPIKSTADLIDPPDSKCFREFKR